MTLRLALMGSLAVCASWVACRHDDATEPSGAGAMSGSAGSGQGASGGAGGSADVTPPGAPGDLAVVLSDAPFGASLTWTAPGDADVAGYLVVRARSADALAGITPENGTSYTPVDTFEPDMPVVYAGEALAALDGAVPLERASYYAVWAVDAGGLYGPPATGAIDVPFPTQRATLRIDDPTGNPLVTVVSQPSHALIAASATFTAPELEVGLSVANSSQRVWFNPKVIVDQISDAGVTASAAGNMPDGRVADYMGPLPLGVGTYRGSRLTFEGMTEDPLTVDIAIEGSPAWIAPNHPSFGYVCIADLSGAHDLAGRGFSGVVIVKGIEKPYQGTGGGGSAMRGTILSPDGRYLVMARTRNAPWFERIDLTTGVATAGPALGADGCLSAPVSSSDGASIYVAHYQGGRCGRRYGVAGGTNGLIDLVRVAADTLEETGRVTVLAAGTHHGGAKPALSPDGTRLALPLRVTQEVALIDVNAMQVIDTDAVAPGDQHVALPFEVEDVHFSPDGTKIYAPAARETVVASLAVIDLSDFSVTTIASTAAPSIDAFHGDSLVAPDGRLWIGRTVGAGLSVVDVAANSATDVPGAGRAMVFRDGWVYSYDSNVNLFRRFDAVTLAEYDWDGDITNGTTPLTETDYCWPSHGAMITPF